MKNKFNFILIFIMFLTFFTGRIGNVNAQFINDGFCTQIEDGRWYSDKDTLNLYETLAECLKEHPNATSVPYSNGHTGIDSGHSDSGNNAAVAGSGKSIKLANPLKTINTIPEFVKSVLDIVMKIGVPLVALAIIYTGYLFIAAQGKPEELKKAKDALVYVFIGSMILLGAYVIAEALIGTVNAIRGK